MNDVKCIINVPKNWTGQYRLIYSFIDGEGCEESVEEGKIIFDKENVVTADGVYIKAILIGPPSFEVTMDVLIANEKYNKKPILPTIPPAHGEYHFYHAI